MRLSRQLLLALALLVSPSCFHTGGSNPTGSAGPNPPSGPVAASVQGGGRVLIDPLQSLAVLGTIVLVNTLAAGTPGGDIRFHLDGGSSLSVDANDVVVPPGQTRSITVTALNTLATLLALQVVAEYVIGGLTRTFDVQWTNESAASNSFLLMTFFGNPLLAQLWFAATVLTPIGVLTRHSSNLVPERLPALVTEVRLIGAVLLYFTIAQLQTTFAGAQDGGEAFPIGQGPNGFTVKASPSVPLTEGDYCTFWMSTSDDIPLADPQNHYQFAFVMDSDLNPANDYTPAPSFPNDFFAGTDRWYELDYTPGGGWALQCKTVGPGNTITPVASAAHMILRGDSIVLFVPRSEFGVDHPPFRATTFRHDGGYGLNPPYEWSGDPTPTVAEPLHAWN